MSALLEQKKKKKQEALLSSAYALFTQRGINNTSISDIVKEAKMAKGTFYLYFKDKYDIRDKLVARKASVLFEQAHNRLQEEQIGVFEDKISFIIHEVLDQLAEDPSLLRFISKNLSWAILSRVQITQMGNMDCRTIFDKLIENSGKQYRNHELMIYLIVELVSASSYSVILYQEPCTLEELKEELDRSIRGIIKQFEVLGDE